MASFNASVVDNPFPFKNGILLTFHCFFVGSSANEGGSFSLSLDGNTSRPNVLLRGTFNIIVK